MTYWRRGLLYAYYFTLATATKESKEDRVFFLNLFELSLINKAVAAKLGFEAATALVQKPPFPQRAEATATPSGAACSAGPRMCVAGTRPCALHEQFGFSRRTQRAARLCP